MTEALQENPQEAAEEKSAHIEHEAESLIFGFWIFLMSDMVLFAVMFATYAAMSVQGVADGPAPSELFELATPFVETMLLLASSFTFGLASLALKYSRGRPELLGWLAVTGILGLAFVGLELYDFYVYAVEHNATPQDSGFLSAFYLLVGTHGVHVSGGLIWMIILMIQIARLGITQHVRLGVMRLALFWHMLDVVWIGIFSFVFLTGAVS